MTRFLPLACIAALLLIATAAPASAGGSFTVTNTLDAGAGSLRQAIIDANATPGTIVFSPALAGGTITLTTGSLAITHTTGLIAVNVVTTQDITVDGNGARIFDTTGSTGNIELEGLTLQNASSSAGGGGAAILHAGSATLTVTDCTFDSNTATAASDRGGAVRITGGDAMFSGCTFFQNMTTNGTGDNGGAIWINSTSTLTIDTCHFDENSSRSGGAIGGESSALINISDSLFTGNSSTGNGGAAFIFGTTTTTMTNCTFTGNTANGGGGGTVLFSSTANATLVNVTISGNDGDGTGGINQSSTGTITLQSCIVAANTDTGDGSHPDVDGAFTSGGGNVIGDIADATGIDDPTDQVGDSDDPLDPRLSDLTLYGDGTLETLLPLPGSPAMNAGIDDGDTPANDANGNERNQGPGVDAGAVEVITIDVGDTMASTLAAALVTANMEAGHVQLDFTALTGTITPTAQILVDTVDLTLLGPGAEALTIDGSSLSAALGIIDVIVSPLDLHVHGVTFANGTTESNGAAIDTDSVECNLFISDCAFTDCVVDGVNTIRYGGAVFKGQDGVLHITDTSFINCSVINLGDGADAGGGGLATPGSQDVVYLRRVLFDGCSVSTQSGSAGGVGGGAYLGGSGTLIDIADVWFTGCSAPNGIAGGAYIYVGDSFPDHYVERVTASGNTALSAGGGLYLDRSDITDLHIINCTVSGNTCTGSGSTGGGIATANDMNNVLMVNCTIAGNTADGNGGGFYIGTDSTVTILNTIIAGNTSTNGDGNDIYEADDPLNTVSDGGNLIGDNDNSGPGGIITFGSTGDQTGTTAAPIDADLGAQFDTRGNVPVLPIDSSSPAFDAGHTGSTLTPPDDDQRGAIRAGAGAAIDTGAYELTGEVTVSLDSTQPGAFITDGNAATVLLFDVAAAVNDADVSGVIVSLALTGAAIGDVSSVTLFADTGTENGELDSGEEIASMTDPAATDVALTFATETITVDTSTPWGVAITFDTGAGGTVTATIAANAITLDDLEAVIGLPLVGDTLDFSGEATTLVVTTQPVGGDSGAALPTQPVIEIRDNNGFVVAADSSTALTASIATGTGSVSGGTMATAEDGVVTFSGLIVSGGGSFTLTFSDGGTLSVGSASFTVTATGGDGDDDNGGTAWPLLLALIVSGSMALACRRRA